MRDVPEDDAMGKWAGRWRVKGAEVLLIADEAYELVISIVHFNTPQLLLKCLQALEAEHSSVDAKVVVVDNASTPPLSVTDLEGFPSVSLISNETNRGFGAANNQVFRSWRGKSYLVINPDVSVAPGTLPPMLTRLASNPRLGALGVRLRYPDGRAQSSCRRYPTLRSVLVRGLFSEERAKRYPSIRRYMMYDISLDEPLPVDWILGSCLLIPAHTLASVGGFDERFFMYYEDIDLCYRIRKRGWDVEYFPAVEWVHDYRRESARPGMVRLRFVHLASAIKFLLKHLRDRGLRSSF